ncbi:MAG: MFS transporter [Pirellula sp.]
MVDRKYIVLACLTCCAGIAYIQRAAMSVPAADIARDLQFAELETQMGWIQFTWYFCYGLMQIPSGWLADRYGSRRTLAALCTLWSVATFLSGFATGFASLLVLWGLMGAAQAGAFPCAAKAIGQLLPDRQRARANGVLASGMLIGGAIAPLLTAAALRSLMPMSNAWGIDPWRLLLCAYAIPGVVWTVAFLLLVSARTLPTVSGNATEHKHQVDWLRLVQSPSMGLLCAQQFFRAAGMVFFVTWFPTFLLKTREVSLLGSGAMTTIVGLGGVVGSLTGGLFSDWLLKRTGNQRLSRQGIAILGMSVCSALIVCAFFVVDANASIALISLGVFFATFGGVSGYTVAIQFGGRYVATVFSTMNMCGNMGAALFPLVAAKLVTSTGNWNLMLLLFAFIMAIDAVCWALLNPKGTLFGDENESS